MEGANEGKDMRRRNRMKPRKEAITVPVSELGSKPNNCQVLARRRIFQHVEYYPAMANY